MTDRPAVCGGTPIRTAPWPAWPQWDGTERDALLATLDSGGWWHGNGNRAMTFAAEFAAYQGARFGLPLTNGTHTLEAALVACGVGEGDEVLVPGMTFVASATAVLAVNATPVLVDVDPDTLCLDPAAAAAAITPRTRAIIAVHVAGAAADLDALGALCARHELHLIEDCAHAHGSTWRDRGVGSWGSFGSFSMQQSKLMTAGEGGALVTNDDELRALAWSYANCGRQEGEWFYHHPRAGSNLRMTEWQGAVLSAQLARFPAQHARRNANAAVLGDALAAVGGLRPQGRLPQQGSQGYYCYVVHVDLDAFGGLPLRSLEAALAAEGIAMGVSYPSLNELAVFRTRAFAPRLRASAPTIDYAAQRLPAAEHAAGSTVWLQHRMLLDDPDGVLDVARAFERIRQHAGAVGAAFSAG